MKLARERAELGATNTVSSLAGEQDRMVNAQGVMENLVDKVKAENREVERALQDLKKAQEDMVNDPIMRLVNLKEEGIVKKSSLVAALLFSTRSIADAIAMFGPNPEAHATAAVVQFGLAILAGAYFFFF